MTGEELILMIGDTRLRDFNGFCRALGKECPHADEEGEVRRAKWAAIFKAIEEAVAMKWLIIERDHERNIESVVLTNAGADLVRDKKDAGRGLFALLQTEETDDVEFI